MSARRLRVTTVVGARPQFVKAAVVSRALERAGIAETLVHTGQHYDNALSGRFFDELGMQPPAHELHVGSGPHGEQTGRMLAGVEALLQADRPDWLLVYGDTNSTLAGALAAAKLHIPVAHVEAGLRSFNRAMPEEVNRVLTDHTSTLLLAPTASAVANLSREGICGSHVRLTGDVMFDAALTFGGRLDAAALLGAVGVEPGAYVLATIHRAENTDDPGRLNAIMDGLELVTREMPVVLPLHPRTRAVLERMGRPTPSGVRVTEPLGYLEMLTFERHAAVVATDSGGVQKEAFFFERSCVTLREETEWVELVDAGWNVLCPPESASGIRDAVLAAAGRRGEEVAPYGRGNAAELVADALREGAP